jgi:hypothetical protein
MNITRRIRSQKENHVGQRFRFYPLVKVSLGHGLPVLWRVNCAGQDTVNVNAALFQLCGGALCQADNGRFRGTVGG